MLHADEHERVIAVGSVEREEAPEYVVSVITDTDVHFCDMCREFTHEVLIDVGRLPYLCHTMTSDNLFR